MRHGMVMYCRGGGHGMGHGHDPLMCGRSFFTKEERAEMLGMYKEWLEKEAKGVEEHLERMKKEGWLR